MRYVHTNDDGTIGLWSCIPLKATKDGLVVRIESLNRTEKYTTLAGPASDGTYRTIIIGDGSFDVADLVDGDWKFEFPDFDRDIKAKLKDGSRIVGYRVGTKAEIPRDYSFRAAWRDDGKAIVEDMAVCREITRERLRKEREPLLVAQDLAVSKALVAEDKTAALAAETERQRLRDITALPAIDAAKTPAELKTITTARLAGAIRR